MIRGVRASSIRIESTSSTIAEIELALDIVLEAELHVVAQIIEAELVVRSVSDVAAVVLLALRVRQAVNDNARRKAQKPVNLAHLCRVAASKIVVDRDDVNAFSGERVEVRGKSSDESFTFTRSHLSDATAMQSDPADHLNVIMTLTEHAPSRFANHGESFGKNLIQSLALREPLPELNRLASKLRIRKRLNRWLRTN